MTRKFEGVRAFTLVELLIVVALIAILSVAVLATINPIEQANKARDARVQNDAAEVLNAYERYYATSQAYPWEGFADGMTNADSVVYRSDDLGFGICNGSATPLAEQNSDSQAEACDPSDDDPNYLIATNELKSSFAGKDEFKPVLDDAKEEQAMWVARAAGADSLYVCYVPKANTNRKNVAKLRCIDESAGMVVREGDGSCVALDPSSVDWATPTLDGVVGMFMCVPE